ncbi:MAG: heme exporter protein [Sphingomonadales bacterium]|nr:heme exporter protein [Sphingomonadales bacterium]MEA3048872.1 heme exporter protein [Sphingomonadales bacterium]
MSAAPLLRLEGVACRRGGRLLFEGLDLQLGRGETALVSGPNGAGKSSLIRLAAGLLEAAAGKVERPGPVALADEFLALDTKIRLAGALALWARLDGGEAGRGMAAMGLDGLADVPVRMLSTGQRKRAVLARLVASAAPLWLLDEPANGLDAEGQACLAKAAAAHLADGGAILVASHQPIGLEAGVELRLG